MSIKQIIKILEYHSINHKRTTQTSLDNARIYAESVYTLEGVAGSDWVDVTDYSLTELKMWLGY